MSFKTHLVAVSPTVPRLDILAHPEGGPEGAQAFIDRSMPGWRLTGETISMLTGRGVEGARYIGTWGPSALIQGDGTEALARDLRARREDGDPTILRAGRVGRGQLLQLLRGRRWHQPPCRGQS